MFVSQPVAIILVLITGFMWGSWFRFVRKIGDWPIPAFMLCLYSTSFVIISLAVLALKKWFIPDGIIASMKAAPAMCWFIFVCGALFAVGMQIQMMVVSKAGLIFSTSITSFVGIPLGFFISSYFGKLPPDISLFRLILGVVFLFAATLLCQKSTRMRNTDYGIKLEKGDRTDLKYAMILIFCIVFLQPSYTLAMSIGTQTALNPAGIPAVLLVGILSAGSLVGTLIVSGIRLTRARQWKTAFSRENSRYIGYACLSGLFHYGGNMIHTIAIPALSMAIAWPLGSLSSAWQYMWGVQQGEFARVKKQTKLALLIGILFYLFALLTLTSAIYL